MRHEWPHHSFPCSSKTSPSTSQGTPKTNTILNNGLCPTFLTVAKAPQCHKYKYTGLSDVRAPSVQPTESHLRPRPTRQSRVTVAWVKPDRPPRPAPPMRMIPMSPHTSFHTSFHQSAVALSGGPEHRSPVSGISQQFLTGSPKTPKSSGVQVGCGAPGARQVPLQEQVSSPRQHWRLQRLHGVPRSSQQLYTMKGPGAAQEGMGPTGS